LKRQEYQKLRDDPSLISNIINRMIRWQTPLAWLRRTATCDTELGEGVSRDWVHRVEQSLAYVVGVVAIYWTIERKASFWS
jgi:hypothetical protein